MKNALVAIVACGAVVASPARHSRGGACAHPHNGKLRKYDHVPPHRQGMSLRGVSEEQLRRGRPVVRRLPGARGRLMSVQDVHAPESVVWDTIMDVSNYPKMVDGVISTEVYARRPTPTGGRQVKARYKIRLAPALSLEYHVTHVFEPLRHAMTFHLDYARRSQLNDMVGYWFVEQLPGSEAWSRVYFSSDAEIPSWLSWARDGLTRQAAYKNLYCTPHARFEPYPCAIADLSARRLPQGLRRTRMRPWAFLPGHAAPSHGACCLAARPSQSVRSGQNDVDALQRRAWRREISPSRHPSRSLISLCGAAAGAARCRTRPTRDCATPPPLSPLAFSVFRSLPSSLFSPSLIA